MFSARGVNSLRGVSIAFLLGILALTLGWKLAVRAGRPADFNERAFQLQMAEFLNRQRFTVTTAEKVEEGRPSISATSGSCRVLVARSPAMGWDRDLIRRLASPADEVFVVYRGRIYAEQPTWLTVPDFLWSRFKRELGISSQPPPVLGIIATRGCGAQELPWSEVVS